MSSPPHQSEYLIIILSEKMNHPNIIQYPSYQKYSASYLDTSSSSYTRKHSTFIFAYNSPDNIFNTKKKNNREIFLFSPSESVDIKDYTLTISEPPLGTTHPPNTLHKINLPLLLIPHLNFLSYP